MENLIKISAGNAGLKCDNPKCDWEDKTIPDNEAHLWIDAPCPNCGENLLTKEDYDNFEAIMQAVGIVNSMSPEDLAALVGQVDIQKLKDSPFLKDAIGLNLLENESVGSTIMQIDTHKGVRATEIREAEPGEGE